MIALAKYLAAFSELAIARLIAIKAFQAAN
jgi:hypothetical protein